MEDHSLEDDILAHHLPSIAEEEDDDIDEHFPTISLDDDTWIEEPVPEKHLCIHTNSHHDLCPYPCPYILNPQHLIQKEAPQYIVTSSNFLMSQYLAVMMICLAWKISLDFKKTYSILYNISLFKKMEHQNNL